MPPMPPPAEPKGPAMWEEVLKNPTVKERHQHRRYARAVRNLFGTGRRRK